MMASSTSLSSPAPHSIRLRQLPLTKTSCTRRAQQGTAAAAATAAAVVTWKDSKDTLNDAPFSRRTSARPSSQHHCRRHHRSYHFLLSLLTKMRCIQKVHKSIRRREGRASGQPQRRRESHPKCDVHCFVVGYGWWLCLLCVLCFSILNVKKNCDGYI
jgi:hypothetical protein